MANIKLDIPDTRVVIRQPSVIVDRSKLPIQSVAEIAITSSYTERAMTSSFANVAGFVISSSYASIAGVALSVLQNIFTGSFSGDGSNLSFTTIGNHQDSSSVLIIGNKNNNYVYQQETIFRNNNLTISGSVSISSDGLLIFNPRSAPAQFVSGGLFFSSSGEFYVGM